MHPARSVIFFTTASGAGYGLIAWFGVLAALGLLPADRWLGVAGFAVGLVLVVLGLLSSTYHLGHPERAWRALSQWRSSWLSREGVAAVFTYLPAGLFGLGALTLGFTDEGVIAAGLIAAIGAIVTVACTSMIYASLKAVPAWASGLTMAGYFCLAGFSGALLLHALLRAWEHDAATIAGALTIAFALIAFAVKLGQWARVDAGVSPSSAESATGLGGFGKVRLLESAHSQANYLMKEMGFQIARRHAGALRRAVVILAFFTPTALAIIALAVGGISATIVALVAAIAGFCGVAVERWLFFAEAHHVVMNYYGSSSRAA